jgi:hypothetical protein
MNLEAKGPPRRDSADGPKGVCLAANPSLIDPKRGATQALPSEFWEAKGVEAQAWYVGLSIAFKKLAHGEASHG